MFFSRLKNGIRTAVAGALFLAVTLFFFVNNGEKLPTLKGERAYYLYSPSSQAAQKSVLSLRDIFHLQGESVSLAGGEKEARALIEEFGAEVLFVEEVGEVVSYYCYTPKRAEGVRIGKYTVNLHIALRGDRLTVGIPMIFGGF